MIAVRKSSERGHTNHGWLRTFHTFSFADFHDPRFMGFSQLRVINEDFIAGGGGFPTHFHRDMEILTYVIDGALEHKDTLGNSTIVRAGELQRMSAGAGIEHSEFNHLSDRETHLLQIWIRTAYPGMKPSHEQKLFDFSTSPLTLVASRHGREGSLTLYQNTEVWVGSLPTGASLIHPMEKTRQYWLQMISGSMHLNDTALDAGDGVAISDLDKVRIEATSPVVFMLFDLP